jgi:hypothetical protein
MGASMGWVLVWDCVWHRVRVRNGLGCDNFRN